MWMQVAAAVVVVLVVEWRLVAYQFDRARRRHDPADGRDER